MIKFQLFLKGISTVSQFLLRHTNQKELIKDHPKYIIRLYNKLRMLQTNSKSRKNWMKLRSKQFINYKKRKRSIKILTNRYKIE